MLASEDLEASSSSSLLDVFLRECYSPVCELVRTKSDTTGATRTRASAIVGRAEGWVDLFRADALAALPMARLLLGRGAS